jgi:hypothetical protein
VRLCGWRESFVFEMLVRLRGWWEASLRDFAETTGLVRNMFLELCWDYGVGERQFFEILVRLRGWREALFLIFWWDRVRACFWDLG